MKAERCLELIVSFFLCFTFLPAVFWLTHQSMLKDSELVKVIKRATYNEIKEKMLSTKWVFNPDFPNSLFIDNYKKAYFHADIFQWEGVGYLLTPYGYIRARFLQKKIRKTLPKYELYKKPYI